jgi:hypothetical protein
MLHYITRHFAPTSNQQIDQLIRDVADRSLGGARRRIQSDVSSMSVAELRGYIAARALRPVRERTVEAVKERRMQGPAIDQIAARALERTVHLLVRQLMVQPAVIPPSAATPRRRAA